ncbi:hypothetical protein C8Q72DRAFT_900055 [Fomitopsis betulina]|nr:hypothetical protein C8Q72DRAFT_900055 [Fomitopsis betulina]
MGSFIEATTEGNERARLSDFFSRLVKKDFDSLAKELPPSPTKSRFAASPGSPRSPDDSSEPPSPEPRHRTLSTISNDVTVAENHQFTFAHIMHAFASLDELRRTAADEIATSHRRFQPLPVDLHPRKMSLSTPEEVETPQTPRSPKKPRFAAQVAGGRKDGAYEATGLSDDPFVRATPTRRRTRGVPETPRARKEAAPAFEEVDREEDSRLDSIIDEALVLNFVREMHERSQVYSSERELAFLEGVGVNPTTSPIFSPDELLGSIVDYRERPMKRRHDLTLDL